MIKNFTFLLALIFLCFSCDEIPPEIPTRGGNNGGPGGDQQRVTIVEEFSGGSCVPCSDAAIILKEQLANYGNNLAVITYHTWTLGQTKPAPGAKYDFRTDDGQAILEKLGLPLGIPSAAIDRKLFDGETKLVFGKNKWANRIAATQDDELIANLEMEIDYDEDSRMLKVDFKVTPIKLLEGDVSLMAVITESEIIDHQATNSGLVEDFEHSHIFRALLTNINGEPLGTDIAANDVIEKSITFTVPPEDGLWVAKHLEVVGFVTQETGASREVLQAAKAHLLN